jgi:hypothetical protein
VHESRGGTQDWGTMGIVEDVVVVEDDVGWGQCLRIRVAVNLYQPLDQGRALILRGKSCWVSFKYERSCQYSVSSVAKFFMTIRDALLKHTQGKTIRSVPCLGGHG